jgi:hypothetical protein
MLMPKTNCRRPIPLAGCSRLFLFLLFLLFSGMSVRGGIQATYYVSPSGSDANPGSLSQPFLTIGHAQSVVRGINTSMTGDIYIYLRGGLYTLSSTLVFTDMDAGTGGYTIFYTAYPGEFPVISGGKQVTGWTVASGSLWKASVSGVSDKVRQIYVNGLRADMSRGPAVTGTGAYGLYQGHAAGVSFSSGGLGTYTNLQDIEMNDKLGYVDFYFGVDTILSAGGKKVVLLQQPFFKWAQYISWEPLGFTTDTMHFSNAYEFLGTPGQFYYNRHTGTLYYTPRDGEAMGSAQVFIPMVQTLVQFNGASLAHKVHNISLTGIEFDYTKYNLEQVGNSCGFFAGQGNYPFYTMGKTDGSPSWHNNQYNAVRMPPSGIQMDNASSIACGAILFSIWVRWGSICGTG